jgi:AAA+ superfamily predicted ATPase
MKAERLMIESLNIAKTATYGDSPQFLGGLARFNFLFGTNGTGKTTLTKVIANPAAHPNCSLTWKRDTARSIGLQS